MESQPKSQRVLVVDDDALNLKVLSRALLGEYEVMTATSGPQALKLASDSPQPHLILLDIMMPGMDGHVVLERLKNDPATADIPVIFITAMDGTGDEVAGLQSGAVDYITKPIHIAIVKARVHTHMELKRHQDLLRAQTKAFALANRQLEVEMEARQKMATALRESELKYRQVFENSGSATIIFDDQDTILMANSKCEALTGYNRRELEGRRKWTEFITAETRPKVAPYMRQNPDQYDGNRELELQLICKNNEVQDILVQVAPWPENRRWIASWVDITDRRRIAGALEESQTYLKAIMDTVETGVMISDPATGRIRDINPHGARLMGDSAQGLIGRDLRDLLSREVQIPWLREQTHPELGESVATVRTIDQHTIPVRHAATQVKLNGNTWAIDSFQEILGIVELLKNQNLNIHLAKGIMKLINGPLPQRIELGREQAALFVAGRQLSSQAEGGDHYFVRTLPTDRGSKTARTLISLKDQSGHAVGCILRSIATDLIQHTLLNEQHAGELDASVNLLNKIICEDQVFNADDFAAALFADIDHETLTLQYLTAGHPPLLLIRDHQARALPAKEAPGANLPLGILPQAEFQSGSCALRPGDRLLMATDGLLEATLENRGRIFSVDDLARLVEKQLKATPLISIPDLMDQILRQMARLSGAADGNFESLKHRDDITILGIEIEVLEADHEERFHFLNIAEIGTAIDQLIVRFRELWQMAGFVCPEPRLRMVLEEGLSNAWHHGSGEDPAKPITVGWRLKNDFLLTIRDEGPGFDVGRVGDPRSSTARYRENGRGLFILRQIADWVSWQDHGRCLQAAFARETPVSGFSTMKKGSVPRLWAARPAEPLSAAL